MAWGARKDTRVFFERAIDVQMMGIDGTWRRDCQLADVSATGARLIVPGSVEGPQPQGILSDSHAQRRGLPAVQADQSQWR